MHSSKGFWFKSFGGNMILETPMTTPSAGATISRLLSSIIRRGSRKKYTHQTDSNKKTSPKGIQREKDKTVNVKNKTMKTQPLGWIGGNI